jgi:hypothetical protein
MAHCLKMPHCNCNKYVARATPLTASFKIPKAAATGVETFSAPINRPYD